MSKKIGGVNDNFDWYCCEGAVIVVGLNLRSISPRDNTSGNTLFYLSYNSIEHLYNKKCNKVVPTCILNLNSNCSIRPKTNTLQI